MLERAREGGTEGDIKKVMEVAGEEESVTVYWL